MQIIPGDEYLQLVFSVCFEIRSHHGKTQAEKERVLELVCEGLFMHVTDDFPAVTRAAKRIAASFGAKTILKRCLQALDCNRHAIDRRVSLGRPLVFLSSMYSVPGLHKPFFERGLHTLALQLYWDHRKQDTEWEPGHWNACGLLEHVHR